MGLLHDARHPSIWVETTPTTNYPTLRDEVSVDVAIVGGGITGLTTALLMKRKGLRVSVVEGDAIASGTTGYTTGKVTSLHTLTYADLIRIHGPERARQYGEANQAAIDEVERLVAEVAPEARFTRCPAYTYAAKEENVARVEEEVDAAKALGLPASLVRDSELPYPIAAAVRFDRQGRIHPRRYCLGLASAIDGDGSYVFEHSRAVDVDESTDGVTVRTEAGTVVAKHAVLATLLPFADIGGFFAKSEPKRSYGIAVRTPSPVVEGMYISVESPSHSIRPLEFDDGGSGLVIVGYGHPTGHKSDTDENYAALERWARETFDITEVHSRWSAQDYVTVDQVPYVGRSPRMARTFVATGFKKWGLTNGTVAAMILTELLATGEHPWLTVFDSTRIGDAATVKKLIEQNIHVGKRFVGDRIARLRAPELDHLAPGEGGHVSVDDDTIGVYRDEDGRVHAVSVTCTHMGCTVHWNAAERSWDCPCHGSRFTCEGRVIAGPAVRDLERLEVDTD